MERPLRGWEHRAYWGANLIGWGADGTNSRRHMGPLPAAGQWVRLEVPASAVGLEGQVVHGLALTLYNGRAAWDKVGKGSVRWLVTDHLGTPRMTADQTGSLTGIRRHDYLPFGEEVGANVGGRTAEQGYTADSVRQKFTGKEGDNETSLVYFGARYYNSTSGRFTSVDPRSGEVERPQSWNGYAYTVNNPVNRIDPDGEKDVQAHVRKFVFVSLRAILLTSISVNVSAGGLFAISAHETGYGRSNAFTNHNNVSGASIKEKPLTYGSLEKGYQAWGDMLKKNFSDVLGIVDPYKFIDAIQDSNGYKYNSANPNYLSTITGILTGFGLDFFDTCVMTPIFSGHGVTFGGVTVTSTGELNRLLTSTQPWDQQAATRFITGAYDAWETYVRNIGTENDANVQRIRQVYSLLGSNYSAEAEALYEYRVSRNFGR